MAGTMLLGLSTLGERNTPFPSARCHGTGMGTWSCPGPGGFVRLMDTSSYVMALQLFHALIPIAAGCADPGSTLLLSSAPAPSPSGAHHIALTTDPTCTIFPSPHPAENTLSQALSLHATLPFAFAGVKEASHGFSRLRSPQQLSLTCIMVSLVPPTHGARAEHCDPVGTPFPGTALALLGDKGYPGNILPCLLRAPILQPLWDLARVQPPSCTH